MLTSTQVFQELLASSVLKTAEVATLPILDTDEHAFAIQIDPGKVLENWTVARGLLDQTGRWPIVTTCWTQEKGGLEHRLLEQNFFNRFEYENVPGAGDVSPRALIAASQSVDAQQFVASLQVKNSEYESLDEVMEEAAYGFEENCGMPLDLSEFHTAQAEAPHGTSVQHFYRWLLDKESQQGCLPNPAISRQDWFEPDNAVMLFLPTASSWEALAYLHWFGAYAGTEKYIALGKTWQARFGAELVAHYGTILQSIVERPPGDVATALDLALEHDLVAPCTLALPGISVHHYATALVNDTRWFLHERP